MSDYKDLLKVTIFETIQNKGWIGFEASKVSLQSYIDVASTRIRNYSQKQKINFELAIPFQLPPGEENGYCKSVIERVKLKLIDLSFVSEDDRGGAQTFTASGSWVEDIDRLVDDECIIVYSAIPIFKWEDSINILRDIIKNNIQKELFQKCVFMRINGETWGKPIDIVGDDFEFPQASEFGGPDLHCIRINTQDYSEYSPSINLTFQKKETKFEGDGNRQYNLDGNHNSIVTNNSIPKEFLDAYADKAVTISLLQRKLEKFESSTNPDERKMLAADAEKLGLIQDIIHQAQKTGEHSYKLGLSAQYNSNWILAEAHFKDAIRKFKRSNDDVSRAHAEIELADILVDKEPSRANEMFLACLAVGDLHGEHELRAHALNSMGNYQSNLSNFKLALKLYNQCLEVWKDLNDVRNKSVAINNVANVYHSMGYRKRSLEMFKESYEIDLKFGNSGLSTSAMNLANGLSAMYQNNKAKDYYSKALKSAKKFNKKELIIDILFNRAWLELSLGNYDSFDELIFMGIEEAEYLGLENWFLHNTLSNYHTQRGNFRKSLEESEIAMDIAKSKELYDKRLMSKNNICDILYKLGEFEKSEKMALEVIRNAKRKGIGFQNSMAKAVLFHIYKLKGDYTKAESVLGEIFELDEVSNANTQLVNLFNKFSLLYEMEDYSQAESVHMECIEYLKDIGFSDDVISIRQDLLTHESQILLTKKKYSQAEKLISESIKLYKTGYNDLYSGYCREVLAKAYFSQEKKDDAFNEIGEALEFTRKVGFVACELKLLRTKLEMEESSGIDSVSTKQRISEIESKFGE